MSTDRSDSPSPSGRCYACRFTVFTAVYNRGALLHRVYDSLVAQTNRDFEWLVVDDGSTEDIRSLVQAWQDEKKLPIRYIYQENGGKHTAHNRGVAEAQGEFFLNLDSDDECVPKALERFSYHWDSIPADQKPRFSAVTCHCVDQHGRLVGDRFPRDPTDSDPLEIRYRYRVRGEKWGFHRTDVLREFPFPEDVKRTYIPESIVWNKIARKYKTRYVNEALRVFWSEGVSQGARGHPARNAIGRRLFHLTALNEELDWFRVAPARLFRSAINYARNSFHLGISLADQYRQIDSRGGRILWALGIPLAYLAYALGNLGVLKG
jgi:glycosyltransferase involved in cell wall biosynthesis